MVGVDISGDFLSVHSRGRRHTDGDFPLSAKWPCAERQQSFGTMLYNRLRQLSGSRISVDEEQRHSGLEWNTAAK